MNEEDKFLKKLEQRHPELKKTYFTKYLPVEGEIKDSELVYPLMVLTPNGRGFIAANTKHTAESVMVIFNMEEEEYYKKDQLKKVKLFLCSRDNSKYAQEILTEGIREGQEFTEEEKDYLTLGSVLDI